MTYLWVADPNSLSSQADKGLAEGDGARAVGSAGAWGQPGEQGRKIAVLSLFPVYLLEMWYTGTWMEGFGDVRSISQCFDLIYKD